MLHENCQDAARQNAAQLLSELHQLQNSHYSLGRRKYDEFWAHVKEIQELFKTLKPLLPADRSRLWDEFSEICKQAKQERERSYSGSGQKRSAIEGKIDDAVSRASGELTEANISEAFELLAEARRWMKDGWQQSNAATQWLTFNEGKMTKEDRDACWEMWKQANAKIWEQRLELCRVNYVEFERRATDVYNEADPGIPREVKATIREIQSDMKGKWFTTEQWTEINDWLQKAWQRACEHGEERRQAYLDKKESRREALRLEIEKNEKRLAKAMENRQSNEERLSNARSEEYADRVRGWIEEDDASIERFTRWKKECEEKLRTLDD